MYHITHYFGTSLLVYYYSARHIFLCHKRVTWPILVLIGAPITEQNLNSVPIRDQHLKHVPLTEYRQHKYPITANVSLSRDPYL